MPRSRRSRRVAIGVACVLVVLAVAGAAALALRDPFRRFLETRANAALRGYTVHIGAVDVTPIPLRLVLRDVRVRQDAHPDAPLVAVDRLTNRVELLSILRGHVRSALALDGVRLDTTLPQVQQARADRLPEQLSGILASAKAAARRYRVIADVTVSGATVAYRDTPDGPATVVGPVRFHATNVRADTVSRERYPSPLRMEAAVLPDGVIRIDGRGDLMRDPMPRIAIAVVADRLPLTAFDQLARRAHVVVHGGTASVTGRVRADDGQRSVDLGVVRLDGASVDVAATVLDPEDVREARDAAADAARRQASKGMRVHVDRVTIRDAEFGVVNASGPEPYRLFVDVPDATLTNLSAPLEHGLTLARIDAALMGTGRTTLAALVRPATRGPDFDLTLEMANTDLTTLDPALRHHARLGVESGELSVYSEVTVRNGQLNGYTKPVLHDVRVRSTQETPLPRRVLKSAVNGVVGLFENRGGDVATVTDVSGPLPEPRIGTWRAIVGVVRNAYVKPIVAGLEKQAG